MNATSSENSGGQIEVIKPGAFTTVQDLGRVGYLRSGVPAGGAMDRIAARVSNLLVGNDENAALLETTMAGPVLRFDVDTLIAVGGARFAGVAPWQPLVVKAGEQLSLDALEAGCRGYVAVAGGIVVKKVLGSASTFTRACLGGYEGRTLVAGDRLATAPTAVHQAAAEHWHVSPALLPEYSTEPKVRVIRGSQWDWFSEEAQRAIVEAGFVVSANSDRMGIRLAGPALTLSAPREMTSEAVAFGSVQVPPDGQPIVLMADRQTIGGYPKIGNVISVDLPLLAQLRPGDRVRFTLVTIEHAQALYLAEKRALAKLREGLVEKLK